MKRVQLAALLWWMDYCGGDGVRAFDAHNYGGGDLDQIVLNFTEWTDCAKERNDWRRVAKNMLAQTRPERGATPAGGG